MRRIGRLGCAAMAAAALVGCRAMGPIGPDGPSMLVPTYSFSSGTASQGFARPRDEVESALRDAMNDLALRRVGTIDWDAEQTRVHARADDGRRVDLTLVERGPATEAHVRVGLFGDEAMSKAVLDRVGVRLGTLPPEAVPAEVPTDPEGNPYFSREAVPDAVMLRGYADSGFGDAPGP